MIISDCTFIACHLGVLLNIHNVSKWSLIHCLRYVRDILKVHAPRFEESPYHLVDISVELLQLMGHMVLLSVVSTDGHI